MTVVFLRKLHYWPKVIIVTMCCNKYFYFIKK